MSFSAFQTALQTCGKSPVDFVCIGDSITEGAAAGGRENGWPARLRDKLRAARFSGSTKGGVGYVPAYYVTKDTPDAWTRVGAVQDTGLKTGLGCRYLKIPNGASMSLSFTGTGLDILLTRGSNAVAAYQIDDNAPITVDLRQTDVQSGAVVRVRGLCDGNHVVTVSGTSLGAAYLEGAMAYRGDEDCGIRLWEGGHASWTCADFLATDRWQGSFRAVPAPKLVLISLGMNEYNAGVPVATYESSLTALVETAARLASGASLLIVAQHQRLPVSGSPDWSFYEDAAARVAAAEDCGFVKTSTVIGDPTAAIAAGLLQSGTGLHPTASGHLKYADAVFAALT